MANGDTRHGEGGGRPARGQARRHAASLGVGLIAGLVWLVCAAPLWAAGKTFLSAGTGFVLNEVTPGVTVAFQSMRLNRAANEWNFEVTVSNSTTEAIAGPLVLEVEAVSGTAGLLRGDGLTADQPPRAYVDLSASLPASGVLGPGEALPRRTLALAVGSGQPRVTARVYGRAPVSVPLAVTRSLNEYGQPLPAATVEVIGPGGRSTNQTDGVVGVASVGEGFGLNTLKFSAPGRLPVWRQQVLGASGVAQVPNPRLVGRSPRVQPVSALFGATVTNAESTVRVQFGPSAVAGDAAAVITSLGGQTLPALLPRGWSPLQAFWLELDRELAQPAAALLAPWGPVQTNETAALVRWEAPELRWRVVAVTSGNGSAFLPFDLPGPGAYAVVVADAGALTPPAAVPGEPLAEAVVPATEWAALSAEGVVEPPTRPASVVAELVTAWATVTISNRLGAIPSGLLLRADVQESYRLVDGTQRLSPPFETFIAAYQRPGDTSASTLHAGFPLRPILLLGPEALQQARVSVELRPPSSGRMALVDASGGVIDEGSLRLIIGSGALGGAQAVQLRELDPAGFAGLMTPGAEVVAAFDLALPGLLPGKGVELRISNVASNAHLVLSQVVAGAGQYGLEPRARWATDAAGRVTNLEPAAGSRLPGLTSSGQFVLVKVGGPQGLVSGVARGSSGEATGGLPVRIQGLPWLTLSGSPGGEFLLVAPVGPATVQVTDPASRDVGSVVVQVTDPGAPVTASLGAEAVGPRVISLKPTHAASGVPPVAPLSVRFDKPVNVASVLGGGVELLDSGGQAVPVSLSLDLAGVEVNVLPLNPLAGATAYTLRVSTNVVDRIGRNLVEAAVAVFTTAADSLERTSVGAQLTSYEPTNGVARVEGTQGFADPGKPVILVNETTGKTSTVLAQPDGSFAGSIEMEVDDRLRAVVVNQNGTRNELALTRQVFADGSVGLFDSGGRLEASTPNGPLQVDIEPGAIREKAVIKMEALAPAQFLTLASNTPPEVGGVVGAFKFRLEGEPLQQMARVSFPVDERAMGLEPGESASNRVFALCETIQVDGVTVYNILDSMRYIDGRVVTHSPPFEGLMGVPGADMVLAIAMWPFLASGQTVVLGYCVLAQESDAINVRTNVPGLLNAGDPRLRRVPGAIVTLSPGSAGSGKFGQRPGAYVARANSLGAYRTMVGVNPLVPGFIGVRAESTRLPNIFAFANVESGVLRAVLTADLIFRIPDNPGGKVDVTPPSVSPDPPFALLPTNTVVTVPLYLTDDLGRPRILSIDVDPSRTVALPSNSPVNLSLVDYLNIAATTNVSLTSTRVDLEVKARVPALVTYKAVVADDENNERETRFSLRFGTPPPPPPSVIPPTDPSEQVRPQVVWSIPSSGGVLNPATPIYLRFSEALSPTVTNGLAVALSGGGAATLELSRDQQTLLVSPVGLLAGSTNTLTVNAEARDLNNNPLDQDRSTTSLEPFQLTFRTPAASPIALKGVDQPAGTVTLGTHHYTLERGNLTTGRSGLVIHSGSNPVALTNLFLPPIPRSMALIPEYSFRTNIVAPRTNITTAPLLVVVGGVTGGGNSGPWIRVLSLKEPSRPTMVGGAILTPDFTAATSLVKFQAPNLYALTTVSDGSVLQVINLQALLLGFNWPFTTNSLGDSVFIPGADRDRVTPGTDLNHDGDYVDENEIEPLPQKFGLFGLVTALASPAERDFYDFDVAQAGAMLAATIAPGTNRVAKRFETSRLQMLTADGLPVGTGDDELGAYKVGLGERAFRVLLDLDLPVRDATGVRAREAALVCVSSNSASWLDVVDVSQPIAPRLLNRIPLLSGVPASPYAFTRSGPDEYLVATPTNTLVLRRSLLAETHSGAGPHPAIVSLLPATTFTRSLGVSDTYFSFSKNKEALAVRRPPVFEIVRAPTAPVTNVLSIKAHGPAAVEAFLDKARPANFLEPTYVRPRSPACPAGLDPADPQLHYYVLIRTSGESGPLLKVAAQSLDPSGRQIGSKGADYPPVVLTDAGTAVRATTGQPAVQALQAHRLSDDPDHPLFNYYLTDPFVVLRESLTAEDRTKLALLPERQAIWSGRFVRVFLDVVQPGPTGLDDVKGFLVRGELGPGVGLQVRSLPGEYVDTPNPSLPASPRHAGVNLQSGEYRFAPTDLTIKGRRQDLLVTRCYESRSEYFGPFGRGWDFNWNARVTEVPEEAERDFCLAYFGDPRRDRIARPGDVTLVDGLGTVLLYRKISAAAGNLARLAGYTNDPALVEFGWAANVETYYDSPPGQFAPLFRFKDGSYAVLNQDGSHIYFRPDGRLDRLVGVYTASQLVCNYRDNGWLDRVTGDRGIDLEFGYYIEPGDPEGRPYDRFATRDIELGLISRIRVRGTTGVLAETAYVYDNTGHLVQAKDLSEFEYVYVYDTARPNLLRRVGRLDGTRFPSEEITYDARGLVEMVVRNGQTNRFSGAVEKASDRYAITTDQLKVQVGGAAPASFRVDQLGRPTEFAGRQVAANEDGQLTKMGSVQGQSLVFYDETNAVRRFRGNLLGTLDQKRTAFATTNAYDGSAWNRVRRTVDTEGIETQCDFLSLGTPFVNRIEERTGPVLRKLELNEFGQVLQETLEEAGHSIVRHVVIGPSSLLPEGESYGSAPGAEVVQVGGGQPGFRQGGLTMTNAFNLDGQPVGIGLKSADPSLALPQGSLSYQAGLLKTETAAHGGQVQAVDYTYDPGNPGRPQSVTHTETGLANLDASMIYDAQGRLDSMTVNGEKRKVTYNGVLVSKYRAPGVSREIEFVKGVPQRVTENGISRSFEYDTQGRLQKLTRPESITRFSYNRGGQLRSRETLDAGNRLLSGQTNYYDLAGRVARLESDGVTREMNFFADGQIRRLTVNGQVLQEVERDDAGRVLSFTVPDLMSEHYSAFDPVTGLAKQRELRTYLTDGPSGTYRSYTTTYEHDALGRVVRLTWPCGPWTFTYDAFGQLASQTDPDLVTEKWTHSPSGLLLGRQFADGSAVAYTYDNSRRLKRVGDLSLSLDSVEKQVDHVIQPDGVLVQYGPYDTNFLARGMTTGDVHVDYDYENGQISAMRGVESIEFARDGMNRLTNVVRELTSVQFDFRPNGQLARETILNGHAHGGSYSWSAVFDELNRLKQETYPSGLTVDWHPRPNGLPEESTALGIKRIEWQGPDILDSIAYEGGLQVDHGLDSSLRRFFIRYRMATNASQVVAGFKYTLTPGGRILAEERLHEGRADVFRRNSNLEGMRVTDFLLSATNATNGAGATVQVRGLAFTEAGEMFSPTNTAGVDDRSLMPPVFLDQGRVTQAAGVPVTYNGRGYVAQVPVWIRLPGATNLTQETAELSYDDFGLVREVRRGFAANQVTVTYLRDGLGRIVQREVEGPSARCVPGTHIYTWKGSQLAEEYQRENGTNLLVRLYAYAGRQLVLVRAAATPGGPFTDQVPLVGLSGSVGGYLTPEGDLTEVILYGPYGTPVYYKPSAGALVQSAGSGVGGVLLFQGQLYDAETGLYELGQRTLHPQLGRFLQRDSQLYAVSKALFAAFDGDPVGRTDPLGAAPESPFALVQAWRTDKRDFVGRVKTAGDGVGKLRASAGAAYDNLRDVAGGYSEHPLGLSQNTLDLSANFLAFSSSLGGEPWQRFVADTTSGIEKLKDSLEAGKNAASFVTAAGTALEQRRLLGMIEAQVFNPRGSALAQVWLAKTGASALELGMDARDYANRGMAATGRRFDVANKYRDKVNSDRQDHLFTMAEAGVALGGLALKAAYGDDSKSADYARYKAVLDVSGKVIDLANKYSKAVKSGAEITELVPSLMRTPALLQVEGVAGGRTLPIGASAALVATSFQVGFKGAQELIIAFSDPAQAAAYKEARDQFEENGGFLTAANGFLFSKGVISSENAYRVQRFSDWSFKREVLAPVIQGFQTPNPIIDFYMRGADAP